MCQQQTLHSWPFECLVDIFLSWHCWEAGKNGSQKQKQLLNKQLWVVSSTQTTWTLPALREEISHSNVIGHTSNLMWGCGDSSNISICPCCQKIWFQDCDYCFLAYVLLLSPMQMTHSMNTRIITSGSSEKRSWGKLLCLLYYCLTSMHALHRINVLCMLT